MKKQAAIDWPLVMKMFAGGALTGAGVGAGSSFLRYLQSLRDRTQTDTAADDDVLYLDIPETPVKPSKPQRKAASTMTYATGGLAGILGTLLAYNAVRGAYQKARKKQLQKELDQAQQIYVGDLGTQRTFAKGASQFGALSKGVGSAYLALFLAALGSGVVANRMLQKQFPPTKSPNRQRPRKIVVRTRKSPEEAEEKTLVSDKAITPDALEGLVRTNLNMPKVANADGSLADLVAAIAAGRGDEILKNAAEYGLDSALDLVKGARHDKVSSLQHNLAITWLCTQPYLSEAIQPLAAAEFQDAGGEWYVKAAAFIPEQYHDDLVGLTEAATRESRKAFYAPLLEGRKIAMDLGGGLLETALLSRGIGSILGGKPQGEEPAPGDGQDSGANLEQSRHKNKLPGSTDTPVSDESTPPDLELDSDQAKRFWAQYGGSIDSAVAKV